MVDIDLIESLDDSLFFNFEGWYYGMNGVELSKLILVCQGVFVIYCIIQSYV